jgi:hypothetical protein
MRRIYLVDLGLLVAAGTLAIVLTSEPASSEADDGQDEAAVIAVSEANNTAPTVEKFSAKRVSYEDDDPGPQ